MVYNVLEKGVFCMAQTNINIRMDEELKKSFDAFCEEVGMSMTTAFTLFAKKTVREQRIPFEISTEPDPFYAPANMERLRRAAADMDAGRGKAHELIGDGADE